MAFWEHKYKIMLWLPALCTGGVWPLLHPPLGPPRWPISPAIPSLFPPPPKIFGPDKTLCIFISFFLRRPPFSCSPLRVTGGSTNGNNRPSSPSVWGSSTVGVAGGIVARSLRDPLTLGGPAHHRAKVLECHPQCPVSYLPVQGPAKIHSFRYFVVLIFEVLGVGKDRQTNGI